LRNASLLHLGAASKSESIPVFSQP